MKKIEERPEIVFLNQSSICFLWSLPKHDVNYDGIEAAVLQHGSEVARQRNKVAPKVCVFANWF